MAENLSFSTFAVMTAARMHSGGEIISVARLAAVVGSTYWAVRNQIKRTPWWQEHPDERLCSVSLKSDGIEKLDRVQRRMATADV